MIWLFLSTVLVAAIASPGFRKFLIYSVGSALALGLIVMLFANYP